MKNEDAELIQRTIETGGTDDPRSNRQLQNVSNSY